MSKEILCSNLWYKLEWCLFLFVQVVVATVSSDVSHTRRTRSLMADAVSTDQIA
jgi:hypothetical protein